MYHEGRPAETGVLLQHNPWGYQVNINHPQVRPIFDRYLNWRKIPPWCPLSDSERREFENYVLPKLEGMQK
ncbi:hypothetical protein [Caproicibacterium amylolyticum]|uniref:Uncharacterized protein n=1 Tax=Caproicibacterium amylolyticum TaxID=2766537 RepID=A0A7G9WF78_9FIRM|nr:hypothetical protein [Caproicibacterium amylolyticum]QNO17340.1 hypothetical protein H6X83_10350 [Caproicibacterium amylolyticum]